MQTTYRYIEDETVTLDDGSNYTNAVLRRCRLVYAGGPLQITGATFVDCAIEWRDAGARTRDLYAAIFRGLYAEGFRTVDLHPDGTYHAR